MQRLPSEGFDRHFNFVASDRVQRLRGNFPDAPINGIAHYRMPNIGAVNANLMRPARLKLRFHQREKTVVSRFRVEIRHSESGSVSRIRDDRHFFAIHGMPADRSFDLSLLKVRLSPHEREVSALRRTRLYLRLQAMMRVRGSLSAVEDFIKESTQQADSCK